MVEREVERRTAQVVQACEERVQAVRAEMLVLKESLERRMKEEIDKVKDEFVKKMNGLATFYRIDVPIAFLPNPKAEEKATAVGGKLTNSSLDRLMFFLDTEMISGIYKVVFVSESTNSGRYSGLACKTVIPMFHAPDSGRCIGACSLGDGGIICGEKNVLNKTLFPTAGRMTLAMELWLDGDGHGQGGTLHFCVEGKQVPYVITKIPPNVHFMFNTRNFASDFVGEVVSYQQLAAPTVDPTLQCTEYVWE